LTHKKGIEIDVDNHEWGSTNLKLTYELTLTIGGMKVNNRAKVSASLASDEVAVPLRETTKCTCLALEIFFFFLIWRWEITSRWID